METEKELLDDINSGSRMAMHRLYDRYVGYAMAVALRYVPLRDDAEDVVQDSFVKVFSSIAHFEFRGEGSLKGWLLRIVANEAVGFMRKQSRITFVDDIPDAVEEETPEVDRVPPEELTRMIGELPDGYRLVLNMFVFEQLSHKEIAERLGIKESSSASQFLRAKKLLGKKIKDYLENGSPQKSANTSSLIAMGDPSDKPLNDSLNNFLNEKKYE